MKEIGERLKETRESIGITIEEASQDLKVNQKQIIDVEEGNKDAFKDIFYLKEFIRNYSKYLGLDYEEMVEEFNEYLFDFTSKISLSDIKKAEKDRAKKLKKIKEVKIASPYTLEKENEKKVPKFLIIGCILLFVIIFIYIIILVAFKEEQPVTNEITVERIELNEFA